MLTNKEIKEKITLDLEKTWENPREANYWLEKLPMIEEYDEDNIIESYKKGRNLYFYSNKKRNYI